MTKKLLTIAYFALFAVNIAFAQSGTLTGTITSGDTGEVLPSVNIVIVELEKGTPTNVDGEYELENIPYGDYTLRVSFVGFVTVERNVTVDSPNTVVDVTLNPDIQALEGMVVTAFGLTREEKSIGYSVQSIDGSALTRVSEDNIVGSLSGKVAGVQVIGASGASMGGSQRIRIRGANGLSEGQPLFVVDGTPIDNSSFTLGSSARGRDLGNLASDLNLQSVESVSVLKGAAAAALYGNRASDGVILIETKSGKMAEGQPIQVNFSNSTYMENVYILPEYQNQYGGGYHQDFIPKTDPADGKTYNTLNYAADESWGPKMDGTMYRPWWSWYDHDFNGDGSSDYGTEIPMEANPDNIRNFFDTGVRVKNNLSISGGSQNASFRVGLSNTARSGVMPNSSLDKTALNFSGALSHSDRFTSKVNFSYVNTQSQGKPAQGYSAVQGNSVQSFNQWFQRQLDMDFLREYKTSTGKPTTWNIRSVNNTTPLYWDSPFFSVNENVAEDDRDRLYGNYQMSYRVNDNFEVTGKLHLDTYAFTVEDRIASGGLEEDWYFIAQRTRREVNYELGGRYEKDFDQVSLTGFVGGNIRTEKYNSLIQQTVGGLSTPNFFNIDASINRPDVSNFTQNKQVNSVFGTATLGYQDMIYVDASLRNDWSSTLPADDNSNLYYGFSTSLVFTELDVFDDQSILSFGKIRASVAQVGKDLNPYSVFQTYNSGTPYGSQPTQTIPNSLANSEIRPSVSSDYEFGLDLRFLDGRVRTDITYYNSVREDEILSLSVPGSSGFSSSIVNAGKFTTTGIEVALGGTAVQTDDFNVEMDLNFSSSYSEVNELAEGITTRRLESAFFGMALFAEEGEEWGKAVTTGGYGGYKLDDQGRKLVADGKYVLEQNKDLGNILPDWTGGFNLGVDYKNFSLGTFVEFQKGGRFYSITQMFGSYSGLHANTVGNNTLGNPQRDPVLDSNGDEVSTILLGDAASNSGGVLVKGVDESGNEVAYLRKAALYWGDQFLNKERWFFDASYIKLREVKLSYTLPADLISTLPVKSATVSLDIQNALLLYSTVDGVDPSIIQNNSNGFGFWEGGGLPGTRAFGFNLNISF